MEIEKYGQLRKPKIRKINMVNNKMKNRTKTVKWNDNCTNLLEYLLVHQMDNRQSSGYKI